MSPRWLSRTLVALAVPALVVPALATPASAAKAPEVPSVAQVTKIYPHLGGESYVTHDKVYRSTKNCKQGKAIKGATATFASYTVGDPADQAATGAKPSVFTTAMKFRTAKAASAYLRASGKTVKCPLEGPEGEDIKIKVTKITFKLGEERQGWTISATFDQTRLVAHALVVRKGKHLVTTGVSSSDGKKPSVKKAVKFTKVAIKTAS
ncbi:hypothetical protein [Nocardioides dongkuii]|uniref:hypothetical protein n=1 Tax=Nocardioides dongkuii TaxID=2760089 RepID=UPI001877D3C8|nr:hypothetical protein [Nocardioides dongkuii]